MWYAKYSDAMTTAPATQDAGSTELQQLVYRNFTNTLNANNYNRSHDHSTVTVDNGPKNARKTKIITQHVRSMTRKTHTYHAHAHIKLEET